MSRRPSTLVLVSLEERAKRLAEGGGRGPGAGGDAISITELYDRVDRAVQASFPGDVWISGEIRSMKVLTNGHCFIDLVDPADAGDKSAPVLNAKCWAGTWRGVRNSLEQLGVALEVGMAIRARGTIGLYKARGTIDFNLRELDTDALMGRVAAERARLVAALVDEDLYDRQRRLAQPLVPLRIGLVASKGTEGYHDFLGQLERSGLAFVVTHVQSAVQGAGAPEQLASALAHLQSAPIDLIAMVRGGGSKADLAAFDHEHVARAVATSVLPVWTGIGHTNDVSVADEVAQRSCITPTECGRELAGRVLAAWQRTEEAALRLARMVAQATDREAVALSARRRSLASGSRAQLDRHDDRLATVRYSVGRSAVQTMDVARTDVTSRSTRLGSSASQVLEVAELRAVQHRRLLGAFDVNRQLERGWSITRGPDGAVVHSAVGLVAGTVLTTQLADGVVTSDVVATAPTDPAVQPPSSPSHKTGAS